MGNFLKNLQSADEATKRKWVVILSAVCILVVFLIWAKYFAFLTRPAGSLGEEGGGDFSFWNTMQTGASVIWEKITSAAKGLARLLGASRSYLIKP